MARVLFVISEDWALATHRLHLVRAAVDSGHEVAVVAHVSTCQDIIEEAGATLFDWDLKRGSLNPVNELRSLLQLRRIIREFDPDIVHAVAIKPVIYAGLATRWRFKGGLVFALGGLGYVFSSSSIKARLLRFPIQLLLGAVCAGGRRRLILQNPDDLSVIAVSKLFDSNRIDLVPGAGVEVEKFPLSPIPEGEVRVILPARLLWDKGIAEFVHAAREIKASGVDAAFVLVGDIDTHNPNQVNESDLAEWTKDGIVDHISRVDHMAMPEIYRGATIVCLPSYREGLSKVLLEACSSGRPVVTFNVPGCRDVVRDRLNGILIPLGDKQGLVAALVELINDRHLCEALGKNGRRIVKKEFSSSLINSQIFEIWKSLTPKL